MRLWDQRHCFNADYFSICSTPFQALFTTVKSKTFLDGPPAECSVDSCCVERFVDVSGCADSLKCDYKTLLGTSSSRQDIPKRFPGSKSVSGVRLAN